MQVSRQYDQDPRYDWASIDLEGATTGLIIIHTSSGSLGYVFSERDETFTPTCICNAWYSHECCCPNVDWSDNE